MLDGAQLAGAWCCSGFGPCCRARRRSEPKPLGCIAGGFIQTCTASRPAAAKAPVARCCRCWPAGLLCCACLTGDLRGRDLGLALAWAWRWAWPWAWPGTVGISASAVISSPGACGAPGDSSRTHQFCGEPPAAGRSKPCWRCWRRLRPGVPLWPFGLAPGLAAAARTGRSLEALGEPGHRWMVLPLQKPSCPGTDRLPLPPFCLVCAPVRLDFLSGGHRGVLRRLPWHSGPAGLPSLLATSLLIFPCAPAFCPGLGAIGLLPLSSRPGPGRRKPCWLVKLPAVPPAGGYAAAAGW